MTKCNDSLILMCKRLRRFKSNVCNKAALEGCIAKGYITTELMTFCSMYLNNALTFHNRLQRNQDGSKGVGTRFDMNRITIKQIYRYIMFNSDNFVQLWM
jgi:hypothetical protein